MVRIVTPSDAFSLSGPNSHSVSNGTTPAKANVASFQIDLAAAHSYTVDFTPWVTSKQLASIQGFMVDATDCVQDVIIVDSSGVPKVVPVGCQATLPIYIAAPYKVIIQGEGMANVAVLNFPTQATVWAGSAAGRGLYVFGGGDDIDNLKKVHAGQSWNGSIAAAGIGSPVTIIPNPVGSPSYAFLNQIHFDARGLTASTPGLVKVEIKMDSVPAIFFARYLYIETVPTPGNVAAVWDMEGLQETSLPGAAWQAEIVAAGAAGFAGEVLYQLIGGSAPQPF